MHAAITLRGVMGPLTRHVTLTASVAAAACWLCGSDRCHSARPQSSARNAIRLPTESGISESPPVFATSRRRHGHSCAQTFQLPVHGSLQAMSQGRWGMAWHIRSPPVCSQACDMNHNASSEHKTSLFTHRLGGPDEPRYKEIQKAVFLWQPRQLASPRLRNPSQ